MSNDSFELGSDASYGRFDRRRYRVAGRAPLEPLFELRGEFMLEHVPAGATGQVRSVAGRFALVAVAGELAREYGILPWSEGEALRAVGRCFDDWLAARGGTGASEEQQAIAQVQAFIEAHGTSRFEWVGDGAPVEGAPGFSRIIDRVGFRRRVDGAWEYHVLPEAWRNVVCKGLNPRRVAEVLAAAGYLTTAPRMASAATT